MSNIQLLDGHICDALVVFTQEAAHKSSIASVRLISLALEAPFRKDYTHSQVVISFKAIFFLKGILK